MVRLHQSYCGMHACTYCMSNVQVREFNDPASKCSVLLLSVRAGGVGLNLQAADTIIM